MSGKAKPWSQLTRQYRSTVVASIVEKILPHCREPEDFEQLIQHAFARMEREMPQLSASIQSMQAGHVNHSLLKSLWQLRDVSRLPVVAPTQAQYQPAGLCCS